MTKNNSLLDVERRTLNNEQITSCFTQFKEAMKEFKVLPQVELVEKSEDNSIVLKFVPISNSNAINPPSLGLELRESCSNMENVKAIFAHAKNCGMCHGGSNVTFNNKNVNKFEVVLVNMEKIFQENYERAIQEDKEQIAFSKLAEEAHEMLQVHSENGKKYVEDMLGKVKGSLHVDEYSKDFNVSLDGLNIDQIRSLSRVITNL